MRPDADSDRAALHVLTWNLFHGRAVPGAGRDLEEAFTVTLAGWAWDVALLQEVPPWWPPGLARGCGAVQRTVLTSRNALLPVRRALARRLPDVVKSNGGGANAILVREERAGAVVDHRRAVLRRWPERRVCHAVALGSGIWVANLHAEVRPAARARADVARAARATLAWAAGAPALLGGDCNVRDPAADGFAPLGGHGVDHVLGAGLRAHGGPALPARGALSDHPAVIVAVTAHGGDGGG